MDFSDINLEGKFKEVIKKFSSRYANRWTKKGMRHRLGEEHFADNRVP